MKKGAKSERTTKEQRRLRALCKAIDDALHGVWPGTPQECILSARRAWLKAILEPLLQPALRAENVDLLKDELVLRVIHARGSTADSHVAGHIQRAAQKDNLDFLCRVADVLNRPAAKVEASEMQRKFWLAVCWVCSSRRDIPPLCFWTDQAIADLAVIVLRDKTLTFDAVRKTRQRLLLKKAKPLVRSLSDLPLEAGEVDVGTPA